MAKYRKKPVVIEATQYQEGKTSIHDLKEDLSISNLNPLRLKDDGVFIETLEGLMKVSDGDYVIKGVADELYPCKPDIFEATYELVEV